MHDPDIRERHLAAIHNVENKKKISERTKAALADPQVREKMRNWKRRKGFQISEEQREKISESLKRYHENKRNEST